MKLLYFVMMLLVAFGAAAKELKVTDGDSLVINNRRIRLQGIDAPEYHQTCGDAKGFDYPCGQKALEFMQHLVSHKKVSCKKIAKDIYKRDLSECYADGKNINLQMLEAGWAVVYRSGNKDYLEAQAKAKKAKIGLWQGKFMKPELYRILMKP